MLLLYCGDYDFAYRRAPYRYEDILSAFFINGFKKNYDEGSEVIFFLFFHIRVVRPPEIFAKTIPTSSWSHRIKQLSDNSSRAITPAITRSG